MNRNNRFGPGNEDLGCIGGRKRGGRFGIGGGQILINRPVNPTTTIYYPHPRGGGLGGGNTDLI